MLMADETIWIMEEDGDFHHLPEAKRADDIRRAVADRLELEISRHIATGMIEGKEGFSEPALRGAR